MGVSNGNSVEQIKITVNGTGYEDIIGGHLSPVNGGTVGASNYDSASDSLVDKNFDAVEITLNGGNIKQALRANASNVNGVVYGNIVYNLNAGSIGIGSGYSGDPMYLMGAGYYGQKGSSTNDVYGNVTINIGKKDGSVNDVFIGYDASANADGFVVGAGTGTVRGDVNINMQSGSAGYVFGASYGAVVKGNTNVVIGKNAKINGYVLGGGSNYSDAFSSDVLGYTNVIIQGVVSGNVYGGHLGGGTRGIIGNGVNVYIDGGSVGGSIYGGVGNITGNVDVVLSDASIGGDIYAGSESTRGGAINGDVNVVISGDTSVAGKIYAGEASGSKNLVLKSYSSGNVMKISDFNTVSVLDKSTVEFAESFETDLLYVSNDSKVLLAEGSTFGKLTIAFDSDFTQGDEGSINLETIFGSSVSIVLSALQSESGASLTVEDGSGQEWSLASREISDNIVSFVIGSEIPEPATYAAIFGALVLAFAAYRRRR